MSPSSPGDGTKGKPMQMNARRRNPGRQFGCAALILLAACGIAHAAHNPFAVAGNEGAVDPGGIGGWLLAQQTFFYRMITGSVRAAKSNGSALWLLAGISFAYGVFHAAGPGHGKAVVASYMVANERALKRGLIISFLAALLQGLVAIAVVVLAALALGATASRMTQLTGAVEIASYAGVALLGAWLLWRKGLGLLEALRRGREPPAARRPGAVPALPAEALRGHVPRAGLPSAASDHRISAHDESCAHAHAHAAQAHHHHHDPAAACHGGGEHCGHFHAPDPSMLGDAFSWRAAALTVVAAGARPCSGAILVLVFSLAQGILLAGVAATFAMSLGTAITTCLLAATAVLFKGVAIRLLGAGSHRRELVARGVEVLAAFAVFVVGMGLLFGAWGMAAGA